MTTPCRHGPQAAGSFVLLEEVVVAVMAQYLARDISLAAKTSCAQRRLAWPLTVHHGPGALCCVCHLVAGHTSPTGPPYATSDSCPAEGVLGEQRANRGMAGVGGIRHCQALLGLAQSTAVRKSCHQMTALG